jgi:TonB family protein
VAVARFFLVRPMFRRAIPLVCLLISTSASAETDIGPPKKIHWPWESRYHALSMPAPIYPYEERKQHLTLSGVISVHVDPRTGLVTAASMKKSTGSAVLDKAALDVTTKWRFQHGVSSQFDVPVSFGIGGSTLGQNSHTKRLTKRWSCPRAVVISCLFAA